MTTATQRLIEEHPLLPPLGRGERLRPWTIAWQNAISPTGAQPTNWHTDRLQEFLGADYNFGSMNTINDLNRWIADGSERTLNYLAPRLKLSAMICYYTVGARYEWYRRFQMRHLKTVSRQIRAKEMRN